MNTTQVGFESLFARQLSATNRTFVVRSILYRVSSHNYLYHRQNIDLRYPSSKSREPVEEVRIKLCASLDTAIRQPMTIPKISTWSCPWSETEKTSFVCLFLNVLFNRWSLVRQVISFLNFFAEYNTSEDGFYRSLMGKREQRECWKWKESCWRRGV